MFENGLELTTRLLEYNPSTEVSSSDSPILLGSVNAVNQCPVNPILDEIGVWRRQLTLDEIEQLYSESPCILGCTDALACNFESGATVSDNSCNYDCQFCSNGTIWNGELQGCVVDPSICGAGTVWDDLTQTCIVANNESVCDLVYDGNGDGVVGASDLLGLLTEYGAECTPETAFTCGDLFNYQGYDYETVQVGEQCWFAENLRAENYRNGDAITTLVGTQNPFESGDCDLYYSGEGLVGLYGQTWGCLSDCSGSFDACNNSEATLSNFGLVYNEYAVSDSRKLCPTGWHGSTDEDWIILEVALGMSVSEAGSTGGRGEIGYLLKSEELWCGDNSGEGGAGLQLRPAGAIYDDCGYSLFAWEQGYFWSSSEAGPSYFRRLQAGFDEIDRYPGNQSNMLSVRCIKDSE